MKRNTCGRAQVRRIHDLCGFPVCHLRDAVSSVGSILVRDVASDHTQCDVKPSVRCRVISFISVDRTQFGQSKSLCLRISNFPSVLSTVRARCFSRPPHHAATIAAALARKRYSPPVCSSANASFRLRRLPVSESRRGRRIFRLAVRRRWPFAARQKASSANQFINRCFGIARHPTSSSFVLRRHRHRRRQNPKPIVRALCSSRRSWSVAGRQAGKTNHRADADVRRSVRG